MKTGADLVAAFREESGDKNKPYFWSDERLYDLAAEAEDEACRRAHLLIDSSSDFCTIPISDNDPLIEIDPLVINIRRAKLSISTYSLAPETAENMDRVNPGWEKHFGTPTTYVTGYETGCIRLYPKQQVAADLTITVSRLPIYGISKTTNPEIRREYLPGLVQWMLHRAYSKFDADSFDPDKAAKSLAAFEKEFGKNASARNEKWQSERHAIDTPTIA